MSALDWLGESIACEDINASLFESQRVLNKTSLNTMEPLGEAYTFAKQVLYASTLAFRESVNFEETLIGAG